MINNFHEQERGAIEWMKCAQVRVRELLEPLGFVVNEGPHHDEWTVEFPQGSDPAKTQSAGVRTWWRAGVLPVRHERQGGHGRALREDSERGRAMMTKVGNVWMNLRPFQIKCLADLEKDFFKPVQERGPVLIILVEAYSFCRIEGRVFFRN